MSTGAFQFAANRSLVLDRRNCEDADSVTQGMDHACLTCMSECCKQVYARSFV